MKDRLIPQIIFTAIIPTSQRYFLNITDFFKDLFFWLRKRPHIVVTTSLIVMMTGIIGKAFYPPLIVLYPLGFVFMWALLLKNMP